MRSLFAHRATLAELKAAGITIPVERAIWTEPVEREGWFEESEAECWINIAFRAPASLIPNFLWCAFATDFGSIRPNPYCLIYLFNLERRVMVWPYDDRGMDVVGPNHALLAEIFQKHRQYLLAHDLAAMLETFEPAKPMRH